MTVYVLSKFHGGDGEEWLGVYATRKEAEEVGRTVAVESKKRDLVVVSRVALGQQRSWMWTEHSVWTRKGKL